MSIFGSLYLKIYNIKIIMYNDVYMYNIVYECVSMWVWHNMSDPYGT